MLEWNSSSNCLFILIPTSRTTQMLQLLGQANVDKYCESQKIVFVIEKVHFSVFQKGKVTLWRKHMALQNIFTPSYNLLFKQKIFILRFQAKNIHDTFHIRSPGSSDIICNSFFGITYKNYGRSYIILSTIFDRMIETALLYFSSWRLNDNVTLYLAHLHGVS